MRKDHRSLRRRPLFTPVWLSAFGAIAAALVVVWLWGMAGVSTVIVVRHAEKVSSPETDPALSSLGVERAQALARVMRDVPLAAIYVSEFRRTRETAEPVAEAQGVEIIEVSADDSAGLLRRLGAHRGESVLVVAHSNTMPEIVAGLGGETRPIAEDEFSRLLIVTTGIFTRTRVLPLRYER